MTTKTREPTTNKNQKEKAFALWLEQGGINAPRGTLNKIAKALNVTDGTVRGWKNKEKWYERATGKAETVKKNSKIVATKKKKVKKIVKSSNENDNVATEKTEDRPKERILEANDMFLKGKSATDIAKKLNVSVSTVTRWRTKYKWVETRERLLIKVTDKLYEKYKRERLKERESSYKFAGLIRSMTMQKLTGKEFIVKDGEKIYLPKLSGKMLAAELSAMSLAIKVLEDTNKYQDNLLGIKDMPSLMTDITESYKFEKRQEIEKEKIQIDKSRISGSTEENEAVISALEDLKKKVQRDMAKYKDENIDE